MEVRLQNIKIGIKSAIGIILGCMVLIMVVNIILWYPMLGAIGIFAGIATIYLYLSIANRIGKDIVEERSKWKN